MGGQKELVGQTLAEKVEANDTLLTDVRTEKSDEGYLVLTVA